MRKRVTDPDYVGGNKGPAVRSGREMRQRITTQGSRGQQRLDEGTTDSSMTFLGGIQREEQTRAGIGRKDFVQQPWWPCWAMCYFLSKPDTVEGRSALWELYTSSMTKADLSHSSTQHILWALSTILMWQRGDDWHQCMKKQKPPDSLQTPLCRHIGRLLQPSEASATEGVVRELWFTPWGCYGEP